LILGSILEPKGAKGSQEQKSEDLQTEVDQKSYGKTKVRFHGFGGFGCGMGLGWMAGARNDEKALVL
jgi:hypothetical protein